MEPNAENIESKTAKATQDVSPLSERSSFFVAVMPTKTEGPLAAVYSKVIELFGYQIAKNTSAAQAIICFDLREALDFLKQGRSVIQINMSREQHKIEAALKDPEMSSRYRFMDINEPGGVLKVLSYLDHFSQSIAVPEIKVTAADLGLPDGLQKSTLEGKRILVLDDTEIHRAAAQYQFGEKNQVDIFSTYKAAAEALRHSQYDYVLLDLLMEPESFMLSDSAFARVAGSEFAAGSIVALVAATKPNTHVIVASDASHHDHPATALLDYLWNSRIVMGNGSSLIFRQASTVKNTQGGVYVKDWVAATGS